MTDKQPEDLEFGEDAWVYCGQHLRPHRTGWCTVSKADKTLLSATNHEDAVAECEAKGLYLFKSGYIIS
jgi:hypothetical protein